jgi:hypothetical protein
VHPGTLKEAISSPRSLHRCLLVNVYCVNNMESVAMDSVFQSAPIVKHISAKFLLLRDFRDSRRRLGSYYWDEVHCPAAVPFCAADRRDAAEV